jgi:hypothetical protein
MCPSPIDEISLLRGLKIISKSAIILNVTVRARNPFMLLDLELEALESSLIVETLVLLV